VSAFEIEESEPAAPDCGISGPHAPGQHPPAIDLTEPDEEELEPRDDGIDREHCQTLVTHFHHRLDGVELEFLRGSVAPRLAEGGIGLTPKQRAWFDQIVNKYLGGRGLTTKESDLW